MKNNSLKEKAIHLRKNNYSYGEISKILGINKSTLSYWLKEIPFDKKIQKIKSNKGLNTPLNFEIKNKAVLLRQQNKTIHEISLELNISTSSVSRIVKNLPKIKFKDIKVNLWKEDAILSFNKHKTDPLFMLGLGLYWGEGSKLQNLEICNSDAGVIKQWMCWCSTFLPNRKVRFRLNIHECSNIEQVLKFWNEKCNIPKNIKVYTLKKRSTSFNDKKNKMPNGVMYVTICEGSFEEHVKMMQWLEMLRE